MITRRSEKHARELGTAGFFRKPAIEWAMVERRKDKYLAISGG
jgi:hypothetical protein